MATDGRPCGVAPIGVLAVDIIVVSTPRFVGVVIENLRRRERGKGCREVDHRVPCDCIAAAVDHAVLTALLRNVQ